MTGHLAIASGMMADALACEAMARLTGRRVNIARTIARCSGWTRSSRVKLIFTRTILLMLPRTLQPPTFSNAAVLQVDVKRNGCSCPPRVRVQCRHEGLLTSRKRKCERILPPFLAADGTEMTKQPLVALQAAFQGTFRL